MHTEALAEIRNLNVYLGSKHVLQDINLNLQGGEIVALIGPNGAGKSSLLRVLAGEINLDHGNYFFRQKSFPLWDRRERARHLAVLPQYSSLSFPYTVEEIVKLARLPHISGSKRDHEIIEAALHGMDLVALRQQFYTQLSGGEKQRTHLARVLAQIWPDETSQSSLLLLDEPCNALDPGHADLLIQQLKTFCRLGVSIVMVLHDLNFSSLHADRIVALEKGKIVADGLPAEVIKTDFLNALFSANGRVFTHPEFGYPVYL